MNKFTENWIQSTLAPESIISCRNAGENYLDVVYNEDKSLSVYVLSNNLKVVAIGRDYKQLCNSQSYSFTEALMEIGHIFNLLTIGV